MRRGERGVCFPLASSPDDSPVVRLNGVVRISNIELSFPDATSVPLAHKVYCTLSLGPQRKRTDVSIAESMHPGVLKWREELNLYLAAGDSLLQPVVVLVKAKKRMLKDVVLGMVQIDISVVNPPVGDERSSNRRVVHECDAPMVGTSTKGKTLGHGAIMRCQLEFVPSEF
jgi:hypothetical protein